MLASFGLSRAERSALPGDPVDQACGIQQRSCFIEELLYVERDFKTLLMKACARRRRRLRALFPHPREQQVSSNWLLVPPEFGSASSSWA